RKHLWLSALSTKWKAPWRQLQKLVLTGYLAKEGRGVGAKYKLAGINPREHTMGDYYTASFWERLALNSPTKTLSYVNPGKPGTALGTRKQLRDVAAPHKVRNFVIFDFHGVRHVSENLRSRVVLRLGIRGGRRIHRHQRIARGRPRARARPVEATSGAKTL